ncbi:NAD(+)/NADH kinase [Myxococcota bacterium]
MTRVIVVAKQSLYGRYVEEENDPHVRLLVKRGDPLVKRWHRSHEEHLRTLEEVMRMLGRTGVHTALVEHPSSEFDTADANLIVTVGGDGTLLAASHNVAGVPLLGVNSAPSSSLGFFCAAHRDTAARLLTTALAGKVRSLVLTRMKVMVNGAIRSRRVLNEALFSHCSPAATTRYIIQGGGVREEQRSSGFWIGPAAGSTGAQHSAGGRILPLDSDQLQLVVREPYTSFGRRYQLLRMTIEPNHRITVRSSTEDARLFLDGPYLSLHIRLADTLSFSTSDQPLTVLGLKRSRRPRL